MALRLVRRFRELADELEQSPGSRSIRTRLRELASDASSSMPAIFTEEERSLVRAGSGALDDEEVQRALLDHVVLRGMVQQLQTRLTSDSPTELASLMRELAARLEQHLEFEGERLMPRMHTVAGESAERPLRLVSRDAVPEPPGRIGWDGLTSVPRWSRGIAGQQLNATQVAMDPGSGISSHLNPREVLLLVVAGSLTVTISLLDPADEAVPRTTHVVATGEVLLIPPSTWRSLSVGGAEQARWFSVHAARGPLQAPRPR